VNTPADPTHSPSDSSIHLPPSEPPHTAHELAASEPAAWSPRARRLLMVATAAGGLLALYGVILLLEPYHFGGLIEFVDVIAILKPMIGVTLLGFGGLVAVQSYRLLVASGPDRPYLPGDSAQARAWFVVVWLIASVVGSIIRFESLGSLKPGFIAATVIGLIVVGVGALWIYRWVGAKVDAEWPSQEQSDPIRKRVSAWSVFWAFVWGIFSTALAIVVEVLLLLLVGSAYAYLIIPVNVTPPSLAGLTNDATFVIGVVLALVVLAPTIEEVTKALGLLFLRREIRSHSAGLLMGMAAGMGFGYVESAGQVINGVGSVLLFIMIWARVATMLMHSVTTGLVGAGYARARVTGNRRALWSGLARAIVLHGAWNSIGAVTIVAGLRGDFCLPLIMLVTLIVLAVRIVPRVVTASIDRSIQDDHAVAGVDLPREWSPIDEGMRWRLAGGRPILPALPTHAGEPPADHAST